MIEIGNVVTLENGMEFLLLEELVHGDSKFVYTVRTEENETFTEDYVIFQVIVEDGEEFLQAVTDNELIQMLEEEFKIIVQNKINNQE